MNIQKRVAKLIKKYKTTDPFELADYMNIKIFYHDLKELRGVYRYYKRNRFIYINNTLNYDSQKIVCCHELGHADMHSKTNVVFLEENTLFSKNTFEIQANKFAAELLLFNFDITQYKGLTIDQIAAAENVYPELVKLKLNF